MPHEGSWQEAGVVRQAALLNQPVTVLPASGGGRLPDEFSLVKSGCENVVVEVVKQSYDGTGIIVRAYESWGKRTKASLSFGFSIKEAALTDLEERPEQELSVKGRGLSLEWSPYEIKTILLRR
ncbi:MAG: glycosyl hydrolase-related protein, partial [Clostridia bacterium]|nr:glycosyl hydrolase-related protein [Clostridia bacterium]